MITIHYEYAYLIIVCLMIAVAITYLKIHELQLRVNSLKNIHDFHREMISKELSEQSKINTNLNKKLNIIIQQMTHEQSLRTSHKVH